MRGSGVPYDLRKAAPYSLYERFRFDIACGQGLKGQIGDCWDRYWVRMLEIVESLKIIEQALDGLPEGDFIAPKISKLLKLPPGAAPFTPLKALQK